MKNKIYYSFFAALLVFSLYLSYQICVEVKPLQVVFLDVGQGDSILVQYGTTQILIDGGPSGKTELARLGKYLPYFDREIELVIATHPDRDHVGGLVDVARNYQISKVIETGAQKDTAVFKEWQDVLEYNKIEKVEAERGMEIRFDDVKMRLLNPPAKVDASTGEANNDSVVARLDYGAPAHQNNGRDCNKKELMPQDSWCGGINSFLFTGDIESPAEKEILESGENINVDVLKIAHHGSKYSSSEAFLDSATPLSAVISVGAKNSYGHPTKEVLDALAERNINILRTDEKGDIVFECKAQSEKCKTTTQN